MGLLVDQPLLHVQLGEILLLAGRAEEALVHGRRALELAQAQGNKRDEPWARFLIGRGLFVSDSGAAEEQATQLTSAISLAVAGEAKPLEAHCRAMLAGVLGQRGEEGSAAEQAAKASRIYEDLDMRPLAPHPARKRERAT
jgi:hypothetical protein